MRNELSKKKKNIKGKPRRDVKLAVLLFMSSQEVESSGTYTANLYE